MKMREYIHILALYLRIISRIHVINRFQLASGAMNIELRT